MIPVLIAAEALAWLLVLLLLWWAAQHGAAEYRRGYRAGRRDPERGSSMRYPLASRTGAGLFWWVIDAQKTWRGLTRAQRTALLAVDSGLPTKHAVVSRLDDKGLTEHGAVTNIGRWVLRVCADRYQGATFELDSPAGCIVVGPVASVTGSTS